MHRLPRLDRIDLHWFAVLAVPRTAASFVSRKTYRRQPPLAAADAAGSPWNLNDLKKWRPRFPWAIQNEKKKKKESLSTHYAQYMTSISFLRLGNSPHTTRNYGKKKRGNLTRLGVAFVAAKEEEEAAAVAVAAADDFLFFTSARHH